MTEERKAGDTILEVKDISLSFGGVKAITDVSFDIKQGEVRAIIGPNGAGKSSMLNVISGFYHPQKGEVWFDGKKRGPMKPYQVARQGVSRTFQNIALFKGMSTLDNLMTGRITQMNTNIFWQAIWKGPLSDIPNLLPIPSGLLSMGCNSGWDDVAGGCRENEYPAHTVTVQSFKLAQHEVTVHQFRRFIDSTGYQTLAETKGCVVADSTSPSHRRIMDKTANWQSPGFKQENSHPVVCITRKDAMTYISWLNRETGKQFRLPTEAEWEYAARAGTATPYSWGNFPDHNRANFKNTNGVDKWRYTSPVGMFPANNFSLQDMSGNAWEWVSDCWHDNYISAPADGSSWGTNCNGNDFIVRRGGAWDAPALNIRSSYRSHSGEFDRSQSYGFRVAHDTWLTFNIYNEK